MQITYLPLPGDMMVVVMIMHDYERKNSPNNECQVLFWQDMPNFLRELLMHSVIRVSQWVETDPNCVHSENQKLQKKLCIYQTNSSIILVIVMLLSKSAD